VSIVARPLVSKTAGENFGIFSADFFLRFFSSLIFSAEFFAVKTAFKALQASGQLPKGEFLRC
jgi:hypothetical protein